MEHQHPDDEGAALVIVVMLLALLATLGAGMAALTVDNLAGSRGTRDASAALDAADAGIARAVSYLRSEGGFTVDECARDPDCTDRPWYPESGAVSSAGSDLGYEVWIQPLTPTAAPAADERVYLVTSRGTAGTGERRGMRTVQARVVMSLREVNLPLGVFARNFQGNGSAALDSISVFSTGCVFGRNNFTFADSDHPESPLDAAYNIPPAVHTSGVIIRKGTTTKGCPETDKDALHFGSTATCRTDEYRWDQDRIGGPCPALASAHEEYYAQITDLDGDPDVDVDGSYLQDSRALFDLFEITDDPLSPTHLENLKTIAMEQGYYSDHHDPSQSSIPAKWPLPSEHAHAVMYFDLPPSKPVQRVDLNGLSPLWAPTCDSTKAQSLLIVINGGNAKLNGNSDIAASVILTSKTDGQLDPGAGNATHTGTVFANTANMVGNFRMRLDQCFLDRLSPSLYFVDVFDYREVDSFTP